MSPNPCPPSWRRACAVALLIAACVGWHASISAGAVVGVLSDGRQAGYLSLLGGSSAAARAQLAADGHQIVSLSSLSPAVMRSVDVVWLPLLDVPQRYTAQERTDVAQFVADGGRVVFIGDADVYNGPDNSLLAAFGISKRTGNLNAGLAPALPDHPVVTGPHGSVGLVGRNASYGLFNSVAGVANVFAANPGPGVFAGFMDAAAGYAGAGRVAIICDASIFGQLLDQDDHRAFLRNVVKWAAAEPGYTPGGMNVSTGGMTGGCGACVTVDVVFGSVAATGETTAAEIGRGRCEFGTIPAAALPANFLGYGLAIETTAPHSGPIDITVSYDSTALASLGITNEQNLAIWWHDAVGTSAVNVTTGVNTAARTVTARTTALGAFLFGAIVEGFGDCNNNGIPDECEPGGADCNANGIPDVCDIAHGTSQDCDGNAVPDECDPDCNGNQIPDACDITAGTARDCNGNAIPDECDISGGTSRDCDNNGVPDDCDVASGSARDCNGNGIPDVCDIAGGTSPDCNSNGIPDACDVTAGTSEDCDGNGVPDECQPDCNHNGVPDTCDILAGTSNDCDGNGVPDECDLAGGAARDCNNNGIPDSCDIASGTSRDCNNNGVPDDCDIAGGTARDCDGDGVPDDCAVATGAAPDCNGNGVPDKCDILTGTSRDCNENRIPDSCDIASGTSRDCNANGVPDDCDLAAGTARDCNGNGIPDSCDIAAGTSRDCNQNGVPDNCDLSAGTSLDCNVNGVPDSCDIAAGTSRDCNTNATPDECEPDCNGNGVPDDCDLTAGTAQDCNANQVPDSCDIAAGTSRDCDANGVPDECDPDCNTNGVPDACDIASGTSRDCNANGVPDECDIAGGTAQDCNANQVPDSCDIAAGTSRDCDGNGVPDECDPDCNNNGVPDGCDLVAGTSQDCNSNGVPDECDIAAGSAGDCNANGIPDACDIAAGTARDCNNNNVPDSCDLAAGTSLDCNNNGVPDSCDIASGTSEDCNRNGVPDSCDPPYTADAGPPLRLCVGQNSPPLGGPVVAAGSNPPYHYQWRVSGAQPPSAVSSATIIEPTAERPRFTASLPGEYDVELIVTDSTTPPCVATDTTTITVGAFSVDAGASFSMCRLATSAPLSPVIDGGIAPYSYAWTIDPGSPSTAASQFTGDGRNAARPTFTPQTGGRYVLRVTVTDSNTPPCQTSGTLVVQVVQLNVAAGPDFGMCIGGESAPLTAAVTTTVTPPVSYAWSIDPGSPDASPAQFRGGGPASANPTFRPTSVGDYFLRVAVRDSSTPSCETAATVRVTVTALNVDAGPDAVVCVGGDGVRLSPSILGGFGAMTHTWSIEPGAPSADPRQFRDPSPNSPTPLFVPVANGSYTLRLTVRDAGQPGCTSSDTVVLRATSMIVDAGEDFFAYAYVPSRRLGAIPLVGGGRPPMRYAWRIVAGPSLDPRQLTAANDEHPQLIPAATGRYVLEVAVTDADGAGCTMRDTVVVEAVTPRETLAVNVEGRLFMDLRIDGPHTRGLVRLSDAAPGAPVTGEIVDEGVATDFGGLVPTPSLTRRMSASSPLAGGSFVAVVVMYYSEFEAAGLNEGSLRLHWTDQPAGVWRPLGTRFTGDAPFPLRATPSDVGLYGIDRTARCVWAVVNHLGRFAIGITSSVPPPVPPPVVSPAVPPAAPPPPPRPEPDPQPPAETPPPAAQDRPAPSAPAAPAFSLCGTLGATGAAAYLLAVVAGIVLSASRVRRRTG